MLIGVPELLAQTWQIYRNNWRAIFTYIAAFFLPTVVLFLAGLAGIYIGARSMALNTTSNIVLLILIVAAGLFAVWNSIALTIMIASLARGQSILPWSQTFTMARRFVWPIIFVGIVAGLIVFGGSILFVIPGIIFLVWYAFTYYRIILDGYPGLGATLRDSRELVRGRWFDVALRLIVPTFLFGFSAALLRGFVTGILLTLPTSALVDGIALNLASAAIQAAVAPLSLIAGVLLYQSAKENPLPAATTTPTAVR